MIKNNLAQIIGHTSIKSRKKIPTRAKNPDPFTLAEALMDNLPGQYFRVGAGAIVMNQQGHVFAIERKAIPGAWQLPQGGLDEQEEPFQGVYRELFEETGKTDKDVEFVAQYPEPLVYELPAELRKPKTGRGQVQYWSCSASRAMRALSILRLVEKQVPGDGCR